MLLCNAGSIRLPARVRSALLSPIFVFKVPCGSSPGRKGWPSSGLLIATAPQLEPGADLKAGALQDHPSLLACNQRGLTAPPASPSHCCLPAASNWAASTFPQRSPCCEKLSWSLKHMHPSASARRGAAQQLLGHTEQFAWVTRALLGDILALTPGGSSYLSCGSWLYIEQCVQQQGWPCPLRQGLVPLPGASAATGHGLGGTGCPQRAVWLCNTAF